MLSITDIFLFPSSYTQLTILGKIGYMFRLEQAIVRPVTRILKRKITTAGGAWGSVVVKALRYATSRTVPGSIPGGVTAFFSDIFPSDKTMALGSTH